MIWSSSRCRRVSRAWLDKAARHQRSGSAGRRNSRSARSMTSPAVRCCCSSERRRKNRTAFGARRGMLRSPDGSSSIRSPAPRLPQGTIACAIRLPDVWPRGGSAGPRAEVVFRLTLRRQEKKIMDRAIVVGSGAPVSPEIPPDPPPKAPPGPPPLADPPAPQPRPAERPPAEVPDVPTPEEIPVTDPGPTPTTPPPITSRA